MRIETDIKLDYKVGSRKREGLPISLSLSGIVSFFFKPIALARLHIET
jgi:hypothetical protein